MDGSNMDGRMEGWKDIIKAFYRALHTIPGTALFNFKT